MLQKIQRFFMVFLALILLLPLGRAEATAVNPVMRIGLFYGSEALSGANLLNDVGAGYRFGYYDEEDRFQQVAHTDNTAISMVKTQNVYYGNYDGWAGYYDTITSGIAVGCYHIQLPAAYATFEEAQTAAAALSGGFPAWIEGVYYARSGAYLTRDDAQTALDALGVPGATLAGTSSNGISVVKTGTDTLLFQFDGGVNRSLVVRPGREDGVATSTHFRGFRYFGDFQYERRSGGDITVVSLIPMEPYVGCVISREMNNRWPLEALKAQAVCARTYAAMNLGRHGSSGFDICNTTHCQVYYGMGATNEHTGQAVDETWGIYARYNGELAQTYYYSCNGGATEDVRNVWSSTSNLPYLTGVYDPYEATILDTINASMGTGNPATAYHWRVAFTKGELEQMLRERGYNCSDITDFYISEFTPTGNVYSVTFVDSSGKRYTFSNSRERMRTMLGLRSIRFQISGGGKYYINGSKATLSSVIGAYAVGGGGQVTQIAGESGPYVLTASGAAPLTTASGDTFTLTGSGWGHNVGMSQWGARAMAEAGFGYSDILKFYFTGIDLY